MLKIHSGLIGLRSSVARRLPAKSFDLTENIVKDLAIWKTEYSSFRNPLHFLAQSLAIMQGSPRNKKKFRNMNISKYNMKVKL